MENKDLKWIKKHYSEKLAHICRELFPTILETEGVLPRLLSENFAQNKNLGKDLEEECKINEFKNYIYSLLDIQREKQIKTNKTPEELMSEAGYVLYPECQTEEDIQSFRHYYNRGEQTPQYIEGQLPERWKGEELCTFNGDRLKSCRVWFAVKKEVAENEDAIKRSENPSRQDEYGTSVISIQFSKGDTQTLSIKNRYNHSVSNPDSTFGNNLDNIIEGLTNSFIDKYNLKINRTEKDFEIDGYVKANDGKFYKYNYEINNIYYCENNTIIDNFEVKKLENRYLLMDYFVIDMQEKKITLYDKTIKDCFCDTIGNIQNINITKDENKDSLIQIKVENCEDVLITLNQQRQIIKLQNTNLKECGDKFLFFNNSLTQLSLPKLEVCKDSFMLFNSSLKNLNLPNLKECRHWFLYNNTSLENLSLQNLKNCGNEFMYKNVNIKNLTLPKLEKCGESFFEHNNSLKELFLPNLKECDDCFFTKNESLIKLTLPNLTECGNSFLSKNRKLTKLSLPNLDKCGTYFLYENNSLTELLLPKLKTIPIGFLEKNTSIKDLLILKKFGPNVFKMKNVIDDGMIKIKKMLRLSLKKEKESEESFDKEMK